MNDKKVIAIIDGDGLAYHSLRETLDESLEALYSKFNNLLLKTQATHYYLFISKGTYFRHEVMPEYKQKRSGRPRPTNLLTLKAVLQDKYNAAFLPHVEADDLCAFFYNNFSTKNFFGDKEEGEVILCSPDKDLLQGIPSLRSPRGHFNYSYSLLNENEEVVTGHWVTTTPEQAHRFFWESMIIGDPADNVPGIRKKGAKYVEKLFCSVVDYLQLVFFAYIAAYGEAGGITEFSRNYRALKLLSTVEDFVREVGHHYSPEERLECLEGSAIQKSDLVGYPRFSDSFLNDDNL